MCSGTKDTHPHDAEFILFGLLEPEQCLQQFLPSQGQSHLDGMSISMEIALGADRPANKPLLYQVDRAMEQRLIQKG